MMFFFSGVTSGYWEFRGVTGSFGELWAVTGSFGELRAVTGSFGSFGEFRELQISELVVTVFIFFVTAVYKLTLLLITFSKSYCFLNLLVYLCMLTFFVVICFAMFFLIVVCLHFFVLFDFPCFYFIRSHPFSRE
jgi:hypothetical protein